MRVTRGHRFHEREAELGKAAVFLGAQHLGHEPGGVEQAPERVAGAREVMADTPDVRPG